MRLWSVAALGTLAAACSSRAPPASPSPDANGSGIGYASVAEALAALRAKPGAAVAEQDGWTIIQEPESENSITLWSFAPEDDPAHPSAVKRVVFEKDGVVRIDMNVLCEAPKEACDQLVNDYETLNKRMSQNFGDGR